MSDSFYSSYLAGAVSASSFLPTWFGNRADRLAKVEAAKQRVVASELITVLRAQDEHLPPSSARRANIDALATPGTVAVITGQQVGLFLGPLYTFYKAATTIAVARAIAKESGTRCVPLFWLQTEDHDFAEIAHCLVPDRRGAAIQLALDDHDDVARGRVSIAGRCLGPEIVAQLDLLDQALDGLPHAASVMELLRAHYRPGEPLARAFAAVLASLFADEGLVIFNPRDATVARLAAPVLRTALIDRKPIEALLSERGQALRDAGFTEQVRLRPGSPLVFFHLGDARGPRYRLEEHGAMFHLSGAAGNFDEAELLALLARDPLRFSTSALLRPIVEDSLFPTVAYVGGPSEIEYFAQIAPLYAHFSLAPPLVVPRARFRLISGSIRRVLDKLMLRPMDVEQPHEQWMKTLATRAPSRGNDPPVPEAAWLAELDQRLDAFSAHAEELDVRLLRAAERTRQTIRRSFAGLERRHHHAVVTRDETLSAQAARLSSWLFPDGVPQERVYSLPYFVARYGARELVQRVLSAVEPFPSREPPASASIVRDIFL